MNNSTVEEPRVVAGDQESSSVREFAALVGAEGAQEMETGLSQSKNLLKALQENPAFQKELVEAAAILQRLREQQEKIFTSTELPVAYPEVMSAISQILQIMKEWPKSQIQLLKDLLGEAAAKDWHERTLAGSIAMTALMMERAKANQVPIVCWWSGKDGISLAVILQAAELAGLKKEDYSIYVADTPFIMADTRAAFRQAIEMGVPIKRVAALPTLSELNVLYPTWRQAGSEDAQKVLDLTGAKTIQEAAKLIRKKVVIHEGEAAAAMFGQTLTEDDYTQIYGGKWRNPHTLRYLKVMHQVKELPTKFVMKSYTGESEENDKVVKQPRQLLDIRGPRQTTQLYYGCLPLGTSQGSMPDHPEWEPRYTYIFPLVDIDTAALATYSQVLIQAGLIEPGQSFDPSRGRLTWVTEQNGQLVLAKEGDPGATQKLVVRYPSGLIFETDKETCGHDDQFPLNVFGHKYSYNLRRIVGTT